jgi:hypothetical protein
MASDRYLYPAIFDYADDGISVEFPDLPGPNKKKMLDVLKINQYALRG